MADHSSSPPPRASSSKQSILELENVRLTYPSGAGPVEVLKGIDLALQGGESVALVGPSGSGKSSLMMVIAGIERPSDGKVTVAGQRIESLGEDDLARVRRKTVGIVFQNFHLIPTMTALENVALALEFAGEEDAFKKSQEALEQVGLDHRISHYPGQLSGGEQQRVALARAFVTHPRLLLADEPTGNLDFETGAKIIDLLFEMKELYGTTLMLITHDTALAGRCERILRLREGHLLSEVETQARVLEKKVGE